MAVLQKTPCFRGYGQHPLFAPLHQQSKTSYETTTLPAPASHYCNRNVTCPATNYGKTCKKTGDQAVPAAARTEAGNTTTAQLRTSTSSRSGTGSCPSQKANPVPATNAPVYKLTSAKVVIQTGSDNKEFPSMQNLRLLTKTMECLSDKHFNPTTSPISEYGKF